MVALSRGRPGRPRPAAAPVRHHAVHAQRHGVHARDLPRPRRHGRDHPGVRGARDPDRVLRRRDRGDRDAAPAHRRRRARARTQIHIFPATHYVAGPERMERAIAGIEVELEDRLAELERQGKLLEAQRLRMRTTYDVEMMRQIGSCSGIENYSRHIDGRSSGTRAQHAARLLPRGLPAGHRRVARDGAADRRDVRGRHVAQADARRPRLPAAQRDGQPAAAVGGVRRADRPDRLPVGDARQLRAVDLATASSSRSSGRPAWSTRRSS